MENHFAQSGLDMKRRIPGASIGPTEPVELAWLGIGKARVDEGGMGYAVDKLLGVDAGCAMGLPDQPRAGGAFQFGEGGEFAIVIDQGAQDGFTQAGGGHQSNGAGECLADNAEAIERSQIYSPPRTAST